MRTVLASMVLACLWAAPAWAQLDPCLSNPAACVDDTVSGATEAVEDIVGDTTETGTDAVDAVTDTGGDVVRGVTVGSGADDGTGRKRSRRQERSSGGERPGAASDGSGEAAGESLAAARLAGASSAARERITTPGTTAGQAPDVLERIRRAFRDSAGTFVFPLALIGLVAAFLLVQARFDRSDPKLALASIDAADDVLEFR